MLQVGYTALRIMYSPFSDTTLLSSHLHLHLKYTIDTDTCAGSIAKSSKERDSQQSKQWMHDGTFLSDWPLFHDLLMAPLHTAVSGKQ